MGNYLQESKDDDETEKGTISYSEDKIIRLDFNLPLFFTSRLYLNETKEMKHNKGGKKKIVLNMSKITYLDYESAVNLESQAKFYKEMNLAFEIILPIGRNGKKMKRMLGKTGIKKFSTITKE